VSFIEHWGQIFEQLSEQACRKYIKALDEQPEQWYDMNMEVVTAYLRVSTARQGQSGLGIEGQRVAIEGYCASTGSKVGREFVEVESGKRSDRAVLRDALAYAKRTRTRLVIGKLDRLARNVAFIANLMESDVEFVALDIPGANRLLLHVMASVAEAEGRAISERTVTALRAAKARGVKLGASDPRSRNLTAEAAAIGSPLGGRAMRDKARAHYAEAIPVVAGLRASGASFASVAAKMNADGYLSQSGKQWTPMTAKRVAGMSK
jgi:DNA invertase Pin-like site-specific DNA recombinase